MNRIDQKFRELNLRRQKGLIIYIGAGDPDITKTIELALSLERCGVDILELGIPFSDPLADGLVNQLAAQRGLASGTTPKKVLQAVAAIRKKSQIPIVLYTYFNLILQYELKTFASDAANCGVDGILTLDLPPEEGAEFEALLRSYDLHPIYLIAPTTPPERIQYICNHASGFVYYISREGVTGMKTHLTQQLVERVNLIRTFTSLPIAVGFGITEPVQAATVARFADAVVVGSAVVKIIEQFGQTELLIPQISSFVKELAHTVHTVSYEETTTY